MGEHLSAYGWLFMTVTWVFIIGLNIFCFAKIFRDRSSEIPDPSVMIDQKENGRS